MFASIHKIALLTRLARSRTDDRPAPRLERVLAVGRAFLTVSGLVAIFLDATEPARLAGITYTVLSAYAIYSLVVLVFVHSALRLTPRHGRLLHGLDILWTSVLTFVSEGPVSPFFLFFLFVLVAAAYRWGFRETFATAIMTVLVFLAETGVAAAGPWKQTWFASIDFELNRTILRVAYLLIAGFLLGYFAEQDKQSRAELASIANAGRQLRADLGLDGAVRTVAEEMMRTFAASRAHVVIQELQSGKAFLWHCRRADASVSVDNTPRIDLDAEQQAGWLFRSAGRSWHAVRTTEEGDCRIWATRADQWRLPCVDVRLSQAVIGDATAITATDIGLTDEWRGRIYLINPSGVDGLERSLHFLEALAEYVTPALTNVFLLRRLRSQVSAAERARVARELHDGAIQALFGLRMKMEAIRRRTDRFSADYDRELDEMQATLHQEALSLRELMQALRPLQLDSSEQLPDVLASVVERFRRDTGISARFVSNGAPFVLNREMTLELVRIVQEALVNVRKHSRARNVLVRLGRDERACTLTIEDDGLGFRFDGRLSADELDERRVGPAIIKERARIAGARLTLDSTPGSGARIELSFGDATHA